MTARALLLLALLAAGCGGTVVGDAIPDPLSKVVEDSFSVQVVYEIVITSTPPTRDGYRIPIAVPAQLYRAYKLNSSYGPQNECRGADGIGKLDVTLTTQDTALWQDTFFAPLTPLKTEVHHHSQESFERSLFISGLNLWLYSDGCHPDNFRLRLILRKDL